MNLLFADAKDGKPTEVQTAYVKMWDHLSKHRPDLAWALEADEWNVKREVALYEIHAYLEKNNPELVQTYMTAMRRAESN